MTESSKSSGEAKDRSDAAERDRRKSVALRSLIDEMLGRVRDLHNSTQLWSADERSRAETDLAAIMARVREEAARGRPSDGGNGLGGGSAATTGTGTTGAWNRLGGIQGGSQGGAGSSGSEKSKP